jgi:hypothetical protein
MVGGGPEDADEPAAAPGRFESEVQAAIASEVAEPIRKLRRERAIALSSGCWRFGGR